MHSALSPCGDNDMTPNNIVNMAILKNLDIIAVSDHNSAENVRVIMERGARKDLIVVPAMEIETAEEVHVLSLFPDLESCLSVQQQVYEHLPKIKNKEEIFGEQLVLNEEDEEVDRREGLLIVATTLSINEVFSIVNAAGGTAIPAHVDRDSHSVISNLGAIPDELPVVNIELSRNCDRDLFLEKHPELRKYGILRDSDAHYLWDISERENYIETEQPITDVKDVIELLKKPLTGITGTKVIA